MLIITILFLARDRSGAPGDGGAVGALLVATASATQDIVVDAFRVESLSENEQAAGMASYVAAYRIGMLVSTAGALFLVSGFQGSASPTGGLERGLLAWPLFVLIGTVTALVATEPRKFAAAEAVHAPCENGALQRVVEAAVGAFYDFLLRLCFCRAGFRGAVQIHGCVVGAMTSPFVIDLGFSRNEYAAIMKGVGLAATFVGGFAGGFLARALPLPRASCLAVSFRPPPIWLLLGGDFGLTCGSWLETFAITLENFASAIGTVIFVAYLSALSRNPLHTATQYAFFTALAALDAPTCRPARVLSRPRPAGPGFL